MLRQHSWRALALPLAVVLVLAPAARAAGDTGATPPGQPTSTAPAPTPTGGGSPAPVESPPPDTGGQSPQPDPQASPDQGREPLENIDPPGKDGKPSVSTQQQSQSAAIDKQKAQESVRLAVAEARVVYERALAKHRVAKFQIRRLLNRSDHAAEQAAQLRRDLGNLARMAYTSGNRDFNLLAVLLESESPQEVLSGVVAAEQVAGHKETEWQDATQSQAHADNLAEEARLLSEGTAKDLAAAKAGLDQALSLAEAVDLAITPPEKAPPVDLTTKSDWVFPTATGQIESEAGLRMHPILHYVRCHAGADIPAPSGTPIFAVDDGVVLSAGVNGGYGNFTLIAHGNGLTSGYGHQQTILVKAGDRVTKGQLIGLVGTTGLSTGSHLHFEARYNEVPYNPRGWLEDHPELRTPVC